MTAPSFVYRSLDPGMLDRWHDWQQQLTARADEMAALIKEVWGDDRKALVNSDRHIVGVSWRGESPVADGWKVDKSRRLLTPKVSTKAGKHYAQRIAAMQVPSPRSLLDGMPSYGVDGLSFCRPGIEELDGAVWVLWSVEPNPAPDPTLWEARPLSEYHALREAADAQEPAR